MGHITTAGYPNSDPGKSVISQMTHKGYTQHLCTSVIGLTCGPASEGFPGNIWMDVTGFIVLLTRTQLLVHTHTHAITGSHTHTVHHTHTLPAGHPPVCHSSSQWCESGTEVKRQRGSERGKTLITVCSDSIN